MNAWETLKLLADPTRLRLVNLILREELAVTEMQEILDMGQSRISSHLALLRQGGILIDRKDGKRTFYTLHPDIPPDTLGLVQSACKVAADLPEIEEDQANLARVIDRRRRAMERYFNTVAGRLGENYCPGRSWEAIGHALLHLTPRIRIVDLGAGEGLIAQLLARQAEHVYCIDNSEKMVEIGTELAKRQGTANLEYLLGDIENVPLPDQSVDLAIMSQALHHAFHPKKALEEAFRILKPDGKLLILDLAEHTFEKARELYADQWLGFKTNTLYKLLRETGFANIEISTVSREEQEPHFETILASGIRP